MTIKKYGALTLAAGLVALAGQAGAATITLAGGGTTDDCVLSNMTTSVACDGDFAIENNGGNVAVGDLDGLFLADGVAINGWTKVDKIESFNQGGSAGDQASGNDQFSFADAASGGLSGTWKLEDLSFDPTKWYVFSLKGGKTSTVYFMNTAFDSGSWTDDDLAGALSNAVLFSAPGATAPVPVPAALPLLALGLGGLGFVGRKRRRANRA